MDGGGLTVTDVLVVNWLATVMKLLFVMSAFASSNEYDYMLDQEVE